MRIVPLLALALATACGPPERDASGPVADWPAYGADAGGRRWSPLTQITPENVGDLEIAWIHRSGDVLDGTQSLGKSSLQVTFALK